MPYSLSLGIGLTTTLPAFPSCERGKASSASTTLSLPPVSLYYPRAAVVGQRTLTLYLASFSTTRDSESLTLRPMSPPGFEAKHPILISSPLGQSPSMCRYAHRS